MRRLYILVQLIIKDLYICRQANQSKKQEQQPTATTLEIKKTVKRTIRKRKVRTKPGQGRRTRVYNVTVLFLVTIPMAPL